MDREQEKIGEIISGLERSIIRVPDKQATLLLGEHDRYLNRRLRERLTARAARLTELGKAMIGRQGSGLGLRGQSLQDAVLERLPADEPPPLREGPPEPPPCAFAIVRSPPYPEGLFVGRSSLSGPLEPVIIRNGRGASTGREIVGKYAHASPEHGSIKVGAAVGHLPNSAVPSNPYHEDVAFEGEEIFGLRQMTARATLGQLFVQEFPAEPLQIRARAGVNIAASGTKHPWEVISMEPPAPTNLAVVVGEIAITTYVNRLYTTTVEFLFRGEFGFASTGPRSRDMRGRYIIDVPAAVLWNPDGASETPRIVPVFVSASLTAIVYGPDLAFAAADYAGEIGGEAQSGLMMIRTPVWGEPIIVDHIALLFCRIPPVPP